MDIKALQLTVISMLEEILKNLEEPQKVPKKEFKGWRKWPVERTSKICICLAYWEEKETNKTKQNKKKP